MYIFIYYNITLTILIFKTHKKIKKYNYPFRKNAKKQLTNKKIFKWREGNYDLLQKIVQIGERTIIIKI